MLAEKAPQLLQRTPPETAKHGAKRGNQGTRAKQQTEGDEEEVVLVGHQESANRRELECILQIRRRGGQDG